MYTLCKSTDLKVTIMLLHPGQFFDKFYFTIPYSSFDVVHRITSVRIQYGPRNMIDFFVFIFSKNEMEKRN